jgi:hypothetical protein
VECTIAIGGKEVVPIGGAGKRGGRLTDGPAHGSEVIGEWASWRVGPRFQWRREGAAGRSGRVGELGW